MFRRAETARERSLIRRVESLEQQNRDLVDRIMYLAGHPWVMPDEPSAPEPEEAVLTSALGGLPPGWGDEED